MTKVEIGETTKLYETILCGCQWKLEITLQMSLSRQSILSKFLFAIASVRQFYDLIFAHKTVFFLNLLFMLYMRYISL